MTTNSTTTTSRAKTGNTIKNLLALSILLILCSPTQAGQHVLTHFNRICSKKDIEKDPLKKTTFFAQAGWKSFFAKTEAKKLFNAPEMNNLKSTSRIRRSYVSSSHLVNALAKRMRNMPDKGVSKKSRKALWSDLVKHYDDYLERVKRRNKKRSNEEKTKLDKNYVQRVQQQVKHLNTALKKLLPSLEQKIGQIASVSDNDLPLSHRDGYLVKMRFQKKGEPYRLSIYPRMLVNQLQKKDDDFVTAQKAWRDFTKDQWQADKKNALKKEVYERAEGDIKIAEWVNKTAKKLSSKEILSLFDLFREVRYGDLPECERVFGIMTRKFFLELETDAGKKEIKRSTNRKLRFAGKSKSVRQLVMAIKDKKRRKLMDRLARDIIFYQDIYRSFVQASLSAK